MPKHRPYVVMPVAHEDKCRENLPLWVERGYSVLVMQDRFKFSLDYLHSNACVVLVDPPYRGWPKCVNSLAKMAVVKFGATLVVAAGDDMRPDPNLTAERMAERYYSRFADGLGVMQPTGDTMDGTDRICGSPIVGPAWVKRCYGGAGGVLCGEYHNFYADEELLNVARELGLLWQDPETCHYHDHWTRRGGERPQTAHDTQLWWDSDKATFERRRAAGWPDHKPKGV